MTPELATTIAFYILAVIAVVGGAGIVVSRNLVHAAFSLVLSFVGVAGVYVIAQADFVAVVQLLVYAGAVAILLIFGVMLTRGAPTANVENNQWFMASAVATLVFLGILLVLANAGAIWPIDASPPSQDTPRAIADLLFGPYLLPFEAASVLLLAALVGAIVLAKEE